MGEAIAVTLARMDKKRALEAVNQKLPPEGLPEGRERSSDLASARVSATWQKGYVEQQLASARESSSLSGAAEASMILLSETPCSDSPDGRSRDANGPSLAWPVERECPGGRATGDVRKRRRLTWADVSESGRGLISR